MTVGRLIKELKEMPQDAEIHINLNHEHGDFGVYQYGIINEENVMRLNVINGAEQVVIDADYVGTGAKNEDWYDIQ